MTDTRRHMNMAAIKGKDTKPEIVVRHELWRRGFRYRMNVRRLPGSPDIVLAKYRTVIFVNGCFWHGHDLAWGEVVSGGTGVSEVSNSKCCKIPHTNREFWVQKIVRNHERDLRDRDELHQLGWNVITIWECELKPVVRMQTLQSLLYTLSQIELSIHGTKREVVPYNFDEEPAMSMVADDSNI